MAIILSILTTRLHSILFSTSWDPVLVQSSGDNYDYALKILCAEVSDLNYNKKQVMEHLGPHDHPRVIKLHHSFEVTGPNGWQICLVIPVCGPSLYNRSIVKSVKLWFLLRLETLC